MNVQVLGEERIDSLGLVRREVVGDHMDLFALALVHHEVGQKRDELRRGVTLSGLAQHLAGLGVERCVQRERAVAEVLKSMAFGTPRRQGQHRVFAIERLNRGLLVHAEHGCVLRRVQVQPDHIGRPKKSENNSGVPCT